MNFDPIDFLAPLDVWVLMLSAILGLIVGVATRMAGHRFDLTHLYWHIAGGIIFFVPIAVLRGVQQSEHWSRLLATVVLWVIFSIGIAIPHRVNRR